MIDRKIVATDQGMQNEKEVTVSVLNYNGRSLIGDTIESILDLDYRVSAIIVVDDGSTDGSVEYIRKRYPEIRVVEMGDNTKMLNKVRNKAISAATSDYILISDNDITFRRDCLGILLKTIEDHPDAAVLMPRVLYKHDKDRIYIDSNRLHYVCASIDENRNKRLCEILDYEEPVRSFGCGIMLIDKKKAQAVGFFDEDYVMGWGDDGEFHHRVNLAGMVCYSVPQAIVYHEAFKGRPRVYGQIRNRWFFILQTYSWKTILLISPALVLYEFSLILLLLARNSVQDYIRACVDVLLNFGKIMSKRKKVFRYKVIPDVELMTSGSIYIPSDFTGNSLFEAGSSMANTFFTIYWELIKKLCGYYKVC
jgi:GT2 family glycosyltransferase